MTRRSTPAALALLLYAAALGRGPGAAGAQEPPPAPAQAQTQTPVDSVRQGVQATLDTYRELSAAGKWDALMRLYADDARFRWVTNGTVVARSVAEIHKGLSAQPAGSRAETTYQDVEITQLAPGLAQVATPFQTRLVDAKGGAFTYGGFLTMVLVERADGWKILSGHASSPQRR